MLHPPGLEPLLPTALVDLLSAADIRQLERRTFLAVLGAALLGAACGSTSVTTSSTTATGTGSTETATGSSTTQTVSGTAVAAAQRIPDDVVLRIARSYNGSWLGNYVTDGQAHGTSTATLHIDDSARAARLELAFSGPLFGKVLPPPTTYETHLDGYMYEQSDFHETLRQLGTITVQRHVGGTATATATNITYDPSVQKVELRVAVHTVVSVTCEYTSTMVDGSVIHGACTWSRDGSVMPTVPSAGIADHQAFIQGEYAASLLAMADLTGIVGHGIGPAQSNGGRDGYAPGIDTSDAIAEAPGYTPSVLLILSRAASAAAALSYWTATYSNDAAPGGTINGLGDAAFIQAAVPDLFVLQGREIADIRVQGLADPNANTAAAIAIARAMLPRLGR